MAAVAIAFCCLGVMATARPGGRALWTRKNGGRSFLK